MEQLKGFMKFGIEDTVYLLKRSLYSLKQSLRQWYKRLDDYILSIDFSRCSFDYCIYFSKTKKGNYAYLLMYVDYMLIISKQIFDL